MKWMKRIITILLTIMIVTLELPVEMALPKFISSSIVEAETEIEPCPTCHGFGTVKERLLLCTYCNGTGKITVCTKCGGLGWLKCHETSLEGSPIDYTVICSLCSGTGKYPSGICPICDGYGKTEIAVNCSTCNGKGYIKGISTTSNTTQRTTTTTRRTISTTHLTTTTTATRPTLTPITTRRTTTTNCPTSTTATTRSTTTTTTTTTVVPKVTWNLDSDGKLTISGKGAMQDYETYNTPWNSSKVKKVVILDGVTNISNNAFLGCTNLTSVTIPDSVTSIGNMAFKDCSSLTSVTIPGSVTSIGSSAFSGCAITSVTIPNSVTSIEMHAFYLCESLTSVTILNPACEIYNHESTFCNGDFSKKAPSLAPSMAMRTAPPKPTPKNMGASLKSSAVHRLHRQQNRQPLPRK